MKRATKYRAQCRYLLYIIIVLSTVHNIIRHRHNWALILLAKWFAFWIFDSHFTSHVKLLFLICFHLFLFLFFHYSHLYSCRPVIVEKSNKTTNTVVKKKKVKKDTASGDGHLSYEVNYRIIMLLVFKWLMCTLWSARSRWVGSRRKKNEKDGKTLSILPTGCKLPPRRRH